MTSRLFVLFAAAALITTVARPAQAACGAGDKKALALAVQAQTAVPRMPIAPSPLPPEKDADSIVGLWLTTFYLPDNSVYDQGFEQWHSDGTELNVDNAVPPVLGNVCVGIWKQQGKTIKLRHVTWNWNSDGTLAGTFVLLMTCQVAPNGRTFAGTFVTDSYDTNGIVIPALHADGTVKGQRINVDF